MSTFSNHNSQQCEHDVTNWILEMLNLDMLNLDIQVLSKYFYNRSPSAQCTSLKVV